MPERFRPLLALAAGLLLCLGAAAATAQVYAESDFWRHEVEAGDLPAVAERLPTEPLVVDLAAKGRSPGTPGGTLRTMVTRTKDVRQMVVYGYARLIGYDPNYDLAADILESYEVTDGRIFTFNLREGHRWSDGAPFTSEDFRYWWEDVANNAEIAPTGPPEFLRAGGHMPTVTFPDAHTVVFEWPIPHPGFLQTLAQASPPFIYRPAHYLKQFHARYGDPDRLAELVDAERVNSWAALHNKYDAMYQNDNPMLPTLQPWMSATAEGSSTRYLFVRNPYYHRVDTQGQQLPYIDVVEMTVVGGGLVAATGAGFLFGVI